MKNIAIFALALVSTSAFAVEFGPGAGGAVPDNNPTGFSSSINIGSGVSAVNSVRLVGLTHTWVGDLTITITNPDNVSATLAARVGRVGGTGFGDSSNYNGEYIFANAGADLWAEAAAGTGDILAEPTWFLALTMRLPRSRASLPRLQATGRSRSLMALLATPADSASGMWTSLRCRNRQP